MGKRWWELFCQPIVNVVLVYITEKGDEQRKNENGGGKPKKSHACHSHRRDFGGAIQQIECGYRGQ